jgi:ParB family chromosome partitioning protein
MIHDLKCWIDPFEEIINGKKKFEFRLNDRNYEVGDELHLNEWDPILKKYTGRSTYQEVTSILRKGFGLPDGYCIMSIEKVSVFI